MFEIQQRTPRGWSPLECACAAARACFATEEEAEVALVRHLARCGTGAPPTPLHVAMRGFRLAAVEPVP